MVLYYFYYQQSMESSESSQSQISSEFMNQNDVPGLNLSSFLKEEYAQKLSQHSENGNAKIFTVAQTLKDPSILSYIKPDYGSLGQFIGDLNLSKDLLNQKKRKNQITEEQQQEKRIRQKLRDRSNKELNQIYLNSSMPYGERKVAGKLMIENIFKDEFGISLQTFEARNNKNEEQVSAEINLDRIDEIFRTDGNKSLYSNDSIRRTIKKAYDNNEKLKKSEKSIEAKFWNSERKALAIDKIKNSYESLRKIKELKKQVRKEEKQDEESSRRDKKSERKQQNLQITSQKLMIQNMELKGERIISFLKEKDIQEIKEVNIFKVRTSEEVLLFIIDVLTQFCYSLSRVTISCISLESPNLFSQKVRIMIAKLSIRKLSLQFMDLDTKSFCIICLGVAENHTLQQLNLNNNCIDGHSYKSLEMICRHCPKLKRISLKKNYIQSYAMGKEMREKIIM